MLKQVNAFYASTQGTKTVFDLVTTSDEAYALFIFMNGYHYWKERVNETKQDKLRRKRATKKVMNTHSRSGLPRKETTSHNVDSPMKEG